MTEPPKPYRANPRFSLGSICSTPGALALLQHVQLSPQVLLDRHVHGDWGEVCAEDAETNEQALVNGARLMSVYDVPLPLDTDADPAAQPKASTGTVWIITEADRSVTTLLLPEEY